MIFSEVRLPVFKILFLASQIRAVEIAGRLSASAACSILKDVAVIDALGDPAVRQQFANLGQQIFPPRERTPDAFAGLRVAPGSGGEHGELCLDSINSRFQLG